MCIRDRCVGTQAQIVSSRSAIVKTEKQASSTQWFLRAGLNIMNFSGDGAEGADSNIGYNATFGYQKPLGSTGGYWGMEFGLGSRGFKVDDTKCMAHNIQSVSYTHLDVYKRQLPYYHSFTPFLVRIHTN